MKIVKCITCGIQLAFNDDCSNEVTKRWSVCDACEDDKPVSQEHFTQNSIETDVQVYQETGINTTLQEIQRNPSAIRDARLDSHHTVDNNRIEALTEYMKGFKS